MPSCTIAQAARAGAACASSAGLRDASAQFQARPSLEAESCLSAPLSDGEHWTGVASLLPHLTVSCRMGLSSDAQLYYMTDFSQASLCIERLVRTKYLNYQCSP